MFYQKKQVIDNSIKQLLNINLISLKRPGQRSGQTQSIDEFMQLQEKQRSETLQSILVIFENTIQALMACYDIFRTDGPEI